MVVVHNQHPTRRFPVNVAVSTVDLVLKDFGRSRDISVVFVNHARMRGLNRKFLNHDYSTDVMAFPFQDDVFPDGELYVNLDKAKSQAKEHGVTIGAEVRRLLIHGTLHLLGHKDASRAGREKMKTLENKFLQMCHQ